MLGPVISHSRSFGPSERSFATNRSPASRSAASTTGCRPPSISRQGWSVSCGSAPAAFGRAMGVARRNVDAGDGLCRRGDLRRRGDRQRGQLLGVRGFGGQRVAAGLDHPARFLVQLGRVEAHDAGQRLAVREAAVRRHQPVGMPGRDLDMIAEHRIVADLQRADRRSHRGSALRARQSPGARSTPRREARRARRHNLRRCSRPSTRRSAARRPARATRRSTSTSWPPGAAAGLSSSGGRSGSPSKLTLQRIRRGQPVAKEREVARRAAACRKAGERACRCPAWP